MTLSNRWFVALLCTALLGGSFFGALERLSAAPASEKAGAVPVQAVVNINKASASELESIWGIGPMLAERIVDYRVAHGRFEALEDLIQVPGIGQAKFEKIKSQIAL